MTNKKVKLRLDNINGNAFAILGAFNKQARKEDWSDDEIDAVINEAKSNDYDHLLMTITAHIEEPD